MPPIHRPLDKVGSEKGKKKKKIFVIHQPGGLGPARGKKIARKRPEVVVKGAQGFPSFSRARLPYNLPLHGSPAPADS